MHLDQAALELFLVFCRVGACLMVVPGVSSARVSVRIRVMLAVVLTLLLTALLSDQPPTQPTKTGPELLRLVLAESLVGAMIGVSARVVIETLEFTGVAIANYVGLTAIAGSTDGQEPEPAIANLVTATGTLVLLLLDSMHALVVALLQSYDGVARATAPDAAHILEHLVSALTAVFLTGLQISAPFLVYGLVANAMFGILGKLVPQMPSYFISMPAIAIGGLALFYMVAGPLVQAIVLMITREIVRN